MATSVKMLAQAVASTTATTIYTVPASTTAIVKEIVVCNTSTTTSLVFDLNFAQSADAAGVKNQVLCDLAVLPTETKFITLSTFLPAGAKIIATASVASVLGVTVSGVEM